MRATPHQEVIHDVLRCLDIYRRAISPQVPGWYVGADEDMHELDEAGWEFNRWRMLHPKGGFSFFTHEPDHVTGDPAEPSNQR
jgi:hypothetical protein